MGSGEPDALLGQVIRERYRIIGKLGEGGMGTVYLAEQVSIHRRVALKMLHPMFARDNEFVQRFRQEARVAASLSNRFVQTIYDFDQAENGSLFIAMEYLPGHTLADLIQDAGALGVPRTVRLGLHICEGLGAAHRAGVIHRDIKPSNVMIVGDPEEARLLDFGIARLRDAGDTRLTRVATIMGTPEYMAPEQIEGHDVTERTDIYSLGVMLYQMLTGAVPFRAPTPGAVLAKHLHEQPRPPRGRHGDVPAVVEGIVIRSLEKDPARRPATVAEVAAALSASTSTSRTVSGLASPRTLVERTAPIEVPAEHPQTVVAHPETIIAHPDTMVAHPDTTVAHPETMVANPETMVVPVDQDTHFVPRRRGERPSWRRHPAMLAGAAVVLVVLSVTAGWWAVRLRDAVRPPRRPAVATAPAPPAPAPPVAPAPPTTVAPPAPEPAPEPVTRPPEPVPPTPTVRPSEISPPRVEPPAPPAPRPSTSTERRPPAESSRPESATRPRTSPPRPTPPRPQPEPPPRPVVSVPPPVPVTPPVTPAPRPPEPRPTEVTPPPPPVVATPPPRPTGPEPSAIVEEAVRALRARGFNNVKVELRPDGLAVLSGSVIGGDRARQEAVETVRRVAGVREVRASLFVWDAPAGRTP
jgi:serine/threonine-protein kinase